MTAFKEFAISKFVLRFYKTDHVWTCTINEDDYHKAQAEIEALKSDTIPYKDLHQVVKNVLAQSMHELTDEEIESAYWSLVGKQHEGKIASYLYNFAKAILKKASEK